MADYYPLIARAVAGLEKNTGDARRALYERARTALVAQLRGVNPPLSENDVTRERLALEESIRKVEAEAARKAWVEPANGATPTRVRAPEFPRWDPPPSTVSDDDLAPPRHAAEPPARQGAQPRGEGANGRQPAARSLRSSSTSAAPAGNGMHVSARLGGERHVEPAFEQPLPSEQAPNMPPRTVNARPPKQDRRSLLDAGLKDFREGVPEARDDDDPLPRVVKGGPRENGSALPASHDFDRIDTRPYDPHAMSDYSGQPMLEQGPDYDEARPLPSKARQQGGNPAMERVSRRSLGDIVRIALTLLILAGLGGVIAWQWPNMMSLYQSARAPAPSPTAVVDDTQPTKTRSTKVPDRLEQTGGAPAPSPTKLVAVPPTAPAAGGAAVAQKVVLYEEDPSEPQQGRQFVGSVVWRTERVSPSSPGQPEELAISAEVEIPDRNLGIKWSLRRDADQSQSTSHTVEVMFRVPQDFAPGSIANVPGILMKQTEQTRGAPLAGYAVQVTSNYYLIGLSAAPPDRENNLRLLKERGWLDIPLVYGNKRRAILAIEKGSPGEQAFAEAFAAWKQ